MEWAEYESIVNFKTIRSTVEIIDDKPHYQSVRYNDTTMRWETVPTPESHKRELNKKLKQSSGNPNCDSVKKKLMDTIDELIKCECSK
jgi:hypothetical protein